MTEKVNCKAEEKGIRSAEGRFAFKNSLKETIMGITKPAIRRLARKGGFKSIKSLI